MDEITRNARRKSVNVNKDRVIRVSEKKMKKFLATSIAIISLLLTTNAFQIGSDVVDYFQKRQTISRVLEDSHDKVVESTRLASNKVDFYYDVSSLIDYIQEDENEIPERLYGVLSSIGFNKSYTVDELNTIVSSVYKNEDGSETYTSFEDYLIKNDFVDKNGEASVDVYRDKMRDYIFAKEQYNEQLEEIKGNKR